jgi:hypothetical protein
VYLGPFLAVRIEAVPVTVKASIEEDLMRPSQRLRADSATGKQSGPASREETRHAESNLARLTEKATSPTGPSGMR